VTYLPLVDTFKPPYEVWETRRATFKEMIANRSLDRIKIAMTASIADAHASACHLAEVATDNGLSNHIQTALSRSPAYKAWRRAMPSKTPAEIVRYQKDYQKCDLSAVSEEIDQYGSPLSAGQFLFHGGIWSGGSGLITRRPLSTSLCPQVALRNAEYKAKAYDAGRIDLIVLRVVNPTTRAFVFKRKGTRLGHESEVLLTSGANLTLKSEKLIRSNYPAAKLDQLNKEIPIYVLEVEVS
jgi:hypothetical protein